MRYITGVKGSNLTTPKFFMTSSRQSYGTSHKIVAVTGSRLPTIDMGSQFIKAIGDVTQQRAVGDENQRRAV